MKIVADENMPLVAEFFGDFGEIVRRPGRSLGAADVAEADVLLVRSVTSVNAGLLAGSRVRFVGTATIGLDHLDLAWLQSAGITVASAPGCNARAVAEYVVAALLELALAQGFRPTEKTLGVVGLGNVGRQVAALGRALGFRVLACDPFVQREEFEMRPWPQLLDEVDILALHTPLTHGGPHPTHHLLNAAALARLRPGAILLNAGRGAVVDNAALSARLDRPGLSAVLDVWEGEPRLDAALLAKLSFGTPHIAGYSLDGKWRGTQQVYRALCDFLGRPATHGYADFLPPEKRMPLCLPDGLGEWEALAWAMRQAYDIARDDRELRAAQHSADPAAAFDGLRKHYWPRREFMALRLSCPLQHPARARLQALGFEVQTVG